MQKFFLVYLVLIFFLFFSYIGSCVHPENDDRSDEELRRDTGCTEALPVPCHGKCSATFVHCLRELYERQMLGEDLSLPEKSSETESFPSMNRWKRRKIKSADIDGEEKPKKPKKKKKQQTKIKKRFMRSSRIKRLN